MSGNDRQPKLVLQGVEKSFGSTPVLRGIDLAVDEHEVVCLIGPSGSGKSTILRCIDLLDPIDGGTIALDGRIIAGSGPDDAQRSDPGRTDEDAVRRRIGIVFQSFNLFPHLDLLANVTLGPRRAHRVPRVEAEERARGLLERFGLAELVHQFPNRMSGGQNQRAAIVRALMMEPEVLLLDEVTSALDPELVAEVLGVIRELRDQGLTMVLATHEMGFARDVATTVAFLDRGRVLEAGDPADVFERPAQERTAQFLRRVSEAGRL